MLSASPTAQTTAPSTGHAQVIAQAVLDLPDGPLGWSVTTIEAEEQPSDLGADGDLGFVLGTDGEVVVRDSAGARALLAGGEALVMRPDESVTMEAAGADRASVSLLILAPSEPGDLGEAIRATGAFTSPGGSRDVELVGDVLAEGETAAIPAAAAPIFVLVTEGSLAIAVDEDETRVVQAGDTVLVPGDLVVTGAAEEQTRFAAAVIGDDIDAAAVDTDTASPTTTPTSSRPRPTSPASSPTPRSSPNSIPVADAIALADSITFTDPDPGWERPR